MSKEIVINNKFRTVKFSGQAEVNGVKYKPGDTLAVDQRQFIILDGLGAIEKESVEPTPVTTQTKEQENGTANNDNGFGKSVKRDRRDIRGNKDES